ncbi:MAG: 1,4-dihydroxy-2-naphthoate octaprenyltransferase [Bacteroidetes bacterium]|nr:1,4-dihydroxy-2-naphthoate octaprenyltransferase [Bacteroidota bacterium]
MNRFKIWLQAFRLRTLPLSLSGILLGTAIAHFDGHSDGVIFFFSLTTTLFFQILSNLANDLGDHLKGADNEDRVGPARSTQTGEITASEMKKAVVIFSILSVISTFCLIYFASYRFDAKKGYIFLIVGLACVIAAITYTMGKKAYGYLGLGDLMVFLFFGLVSVIGVYNLYVPEFSMRPLFGALTIGLLSTAVLNLNNLRDHVNDKLVGKNTLVVKIGLINGKVYQFFLLIMAFVSAIYMSFQLSYLLFVPCLFFVIIAFHANRMWKNRIPAELDPELKVVALTTFGWAFVSALILFYI